MQFKIRRLKYVVPVVACLLSPRGEGAVNTLSIRSKHAHILQMWEGGTHTHVLHKQTYTYIPTPPGERQMTLELKVYVRP